MDKRMAQQMMKISSNPELNASTYTHLGTRALYEIATLPEPERTIEHTTSNSTPVLHLGVKALYQLATLPEED